MTMVPNKCDVVVIGGGPAGSTAAGMLAKAGLDVVLLDKVKFPRNTIGESIVPQVWKLAEILGVSKKLADEGFVAKAGGIAVWGDKISNLRFSEFGYKQPGLHTERDIFDNLLLRHASDLGVRVFQNVIARRADVSHPGRPRVLYDDRGSGRDVAGTIDARFIVDASGFSSLMSKQFNSRSFLQSDRKFLSIWGYYEDSRFFDCEGNSHPNTDLAHVKPVTLQVQHDDGWAWHIIMRKTTSVGFAMYSDRVRPMDAEDREAYFIERVAQTPHLNSLLSGARYIPGSLCYRPDYSYFTTSIVGADHICVGDAAAFVDPVYSQGVLGCMFHGVAGAWAITRSLEQPARKAEYLEMFRRRIMGLYSAARLIALGHFGAPGVDLELAKETARGLPPSEILLLYTAAWMTDRAQNIARLAAECGMDGSGLKPRMHSIARLA